MNYDMKSYLAWGEILENEQPVHGGSAEASRECRSD